MTIDHLVGNNKANCLGRKERGGFPAMAMMRLNSQVQQFGGFTPGGRGGGGVFGMTPKMPIGAAGSPHFEDFTNPKEAKITKTHHLLAIILQIRQESITAYFNGILNLRVNRRFAPIGN